MATGRIAEALHLEQTDLVKTTREEVDNVPIVGHTLRQSFVELQTMSMKLGLNDQERTLVARLKCFALSRSMSWCERIASLSSLLTTIPGPSVAGPPANNMTLAPVFGNVV